MRAVVTRVTSASVTIDGVTVGQIQRGLLILLGIGPQDGEAQCRRLAEKALGLRIFEDENGKMNLGLEQVGGSVLVVSQFTLYGSCRHGGGPASPRRRIPSWATGCMSGFWRCARSWAIRRSMAGSARICRWRR